MLKNRDIDSVYSVRMLLKSNFPLTRSWSHCDRILGKSLVEWGGKEIASVHIFVYVDAIIKRRQLLCQSRPDKHKKSPTSYDAGPFIRLGS